MNLRLREDSTKKWTAALSPGTSKVSGKTTRLNAFVKI